MEKRVSRGEADSAHRKGPAAHRKDKKYPPRTGKRIPAAHRKKKKDPPRTGKRIPAAHRKIRKTRRAHSAQEMPAAREGQSIPAHFEGIEQVFVEAAPEPDPAEAEKPGDWAGKPGRACKKKLGQREPAARPCVLESPQRLDRP